MSPADLDHVLEEAADAVLVCPALHQLSTGVRLEAANLIRRDLKRRLLDPKLTTFRIEEKRA